MEQHRLTTAAAYAKKNLLQAPGDLHVSTTVTLSQSQCECMTNGQPIVLSLMEAIDNCAALQQTLTRLVSGSYYPSEKKWAVNFRLMTASAEGISCHSSNKGNFIAMSMGVHFIEGTETPFDFLVEAPNGIKVAKLIDLRDSEFSFYKGDVHSFVHPLEPQQTDREYVFFEKDAIFLPNMAAVHNQDEDEEDSEKKPEDEDAGWEEETRDEDVPPDSRMFYGNQLTNSKFHSNLSKRPTHSKVFTSDAGRGAIDSHRVVVLPNNSFFAHWYKDSEGPRDANGITVPADQHASMVHSFQSRRLRDRSCDFDSMFLVINGDCQENRSITFKLNLTVRPIIEAFGTDTNGARVHASPMDMVLMNTVHAQLKAAKENEPIHLSQSSSSEQSGPAPRRHAASASRGVIGKTV